MARTVVTMRLLVAVAAMWVPYSAWATDPQPPPGPELLEQHEPRYPPEARQAGEHGMVWVAVQVDGWERRA